MLTYALIVGYMSSILQNKHILSVGMQQNSRTVILATARGTIYDRNMLPLNNIGIRYYGVLVPELKQLNRLKSDMSEAEYQRLKKELTEQNLLVANLKKISYIGPKIYTFQTPIRYDNQTVHSPLMGTINENDVTGKSGIEKSYDGLLSRYSGKISVSYPVNGVGACSPEGPLKITNTLRKSKGGIQLTIDKTAQKQLNALVNNRLSEGAAFILDTKTAELLAYSEPTVNETASTTEPIQLLTHYTGALPQKIVIAAAALESGLTAEQTLLCPGQLTLGETTYTCSNPLGHHLLNMQEAFAQNCPLYFIQLAQQLGDAILHKTAKSLGLYDALELAEDIIAHAAPAHNLNETFLHDPLTITPLHLAQIAAIIANGGTKNNPTAVLGTVNENKEQTPKKQGRGVYALSKQSARTLKDVIKPYFYEDLGHTRLYVGLTSQYVVAIVTKDPSTNQQTLQDLYQEISNVMR